MKNLICLILFFLSLASFSQNNEKKFALVIGNSNYKSGAMPLKNPVNDARLIAGTLKGFGFDVIEKHDADLKTMQLATADFTNRIKNYDVVLFYYAGHGIQVKGKNYLIPVDAKLETQVMAQFEAFDISFINNAFTENAGNMNIMILDACRDNPFRSWMRGGSKGFKAVSNQAAGTIIAFATREGETASDGLGNNGLYTEKLVQEMKKAQDLNSVFKNTRIQVLKATDNIQCPQEWDMTTGDFSFVKDGSLIINNNVEPEIGGLVGGKVIHKYGNIIIDTEIGGKLYFDGKYMGTIHANSKGNKLQKQLIGKHIIRIEGDEFFEQNISISENQTTEIAIFSRKINTRNNSSIKKDNLPNKLLDSRDSKTYRTVKIGSQIWMAGNLAYKTDSGCWAYKDKEKHSNNYGYLYSWETAKNVCPVGWHLPAKAEYEELLNNYAGIKNSNANFRANYNALIHGGKSGFLIYLGGWRNSRGNFNYIGASTCFWSSSEYNSKQAWRLGVTRLQQGALGITKGDKKFGYYVRCIKDN